MDLSLEGWLSGGRCLGSAVPRVRERDDVVSDRTRQEMLQPVRCPAASAIVQQVSVLSGNVPGTVRA
jgi:hypothetical protein